MLRWITISALSALALTSASGCLGSDGPRAPSGSLRVSVLPLQLDGVGEVVWDVQVQSAAGPVWHETVSSTRYGDGHGSFAYVGPCDASANPHTVTVTVTSLADDTGRVLASPGDWKNPGPISQPATCVENADVPVVFDVTILRAARQGFFDVAVSFEDLFCSAKLDCSESLLHGPDGERGATVVMGFACTSGDATPTWLYLGDATIDCVDAHPSDANVLAPLTARLSLATAADGQQGARAPIVAEWARYSGKEALPGLDKCYWNHAFGLDLAAIGDRRCTLTATGTAADHQLTGGTVASDVVWPVITWSVEVLGEGGALCQNNALDVIGSGVQSGYLVPPTDGSAHPSFAAELACGQAVTAVGATCEGDDGAIFRATTVEGAPAVAVTVGGVPSVSAYRVPTGAHLPADGACCIDSCCQAN